MPSVDEVLCRFGSLLAESDDDVYKLLEALVCKFGDSESEGKWTRMTDEFNKRVVNPRSKRWIKRTICRLHQSAEVGDALVKESGSRGQSQPQNQIRRVDFLERLLMVHGLVGDDLLRRGRKMFKRFGMGFFGVVFQTEADLQNMKPVSLSDNWLLLGTITDGDAKRIWKAVFAYDTGSGVGKHMEPELGDALKMYNPETEVILVVFKHESHDLLYEGYHLYSKWLSTKGLADPEKKAPSVRCWRRESPLSAELTLLEDEQTEKYVRSQVIRDEEAKLRWEHLLPEPKMQRPDLLSRVSALLQIDFPPELPSTLPSSRSLVLQRKREELLAYAKDEVQKYLCESADDGSTLLYYFKIRPCVLREIINFFGSRDAFFEARGRCATWQRWTEALDTNTAKQRLSTVIQKHHITTSRIRSRCFVCGHREVKPCSGCGTMFYCGQDCQRKDWRRHKPECNQTNPDSET